VSLAKVKSRQNAQIQLCRSLQDGSARRRHSLYLIEGVNGLEEAVRHHVPVQSVLWSERLADQPRGQALLSDLQSQGIALQAVDPALIDYVASTESPQGVVAIAPLPVYRLDAVMGPGRWTVMLDGVSDPGNVGTILRTAAAAGVDGVLLWGPGCDPWNPKTVRASAGVACWFPVVRIDTLSALGDATLMATSSHEGRAYTDVQVYSGVMVIGSESHGVSAAVAEHVEHWIHIPMEPGVESLNAAVAAGIILFHARHCRENRARGA
jgi:TrmH family RNA methyltransferase